MAYKFQLGQARLSGSVIQEGDVTAQSSQLNASTLDLADASGIAGAGMEDQSGNLGIAALGVTNAMLAGSIASAKIAELNAFNTANLAEGSNLYYTEGRWDSKMAAADTADLSEGSNLYYTEGRARAAVSVTDAGGDGSLSYNSTSGVITYTGPSAGEVQAHVGVLDTATIDMSVAAGVFSADVKAVSITNAMLAGAIASSKIAELNAFDTADLAEGSNLYYTQARFDSALAAKDTGDLSEGSNLYYTDVRAKSAVSATSDVAGRGSLAYNSTTGVFAYEGVTQAEIWSDFSVSNISGDGSLAYNAASGLFSYTGPSAAEVRAHLSVTDAGGDGSLAYDSGTGAITYTGPSAAEVRAHVSVLDSNSVDMILASGEFSADVKIMSDALEILPPVAGTHAGGVSLKSTIAGNRTFSDNVIVSGDLSVNGALTYVNTTNLAITDALITVGSGSAAFAANYGMEFGEVGNGWASLKTSADVSIGGGAAVAGFEFSHPLTASRFFGEFVGASVESVQTLTAAAAIVSANGTQILLNHAASASFSLPAASAMKGLVLKIKRIGTAESTITPAGAELIEGGSSIKLESVGAAVSIISDGSNYHVI